jgi:integrase
MRGETATRLLLLTGCRRGEILNLRWEHVDLDNQCLRLPEFDRVLIGSAIDFRSAIAR